MPSSLLRPMLYGFALLSLGTTGLLADDSSARNQPTNNRATNFEGAGIPGPILLAGATENGESLRNQVKTLSEGTSDRKIRRTAQARIPLAHMTPQNRQRVEHILNNQSMFRKMPTLQVPVDHEAYQYFINHPDVAVATWRTLGVSNCQLWQTGPNNYETDLGDGSFGVLDVVYRGPNDQIVIGSGEFKSPLLVKPIKAEGILHLHTQYVTHKNGATEVQCEGTLFVTFPSQTVETAAKVVSPLTNMVIDRNFQEVGLYAHMMTTAMRNQPGWIETLAGQLDGILESSRSELLEVTARTYVRQRKRDQQLTTQGLIRPAHSETVRK